MKTQAEIAERLRREADGRFGKRRGIECEMRFVAICAAMMKAGEAPWWWKDIVRATEQEDKNGADFYVHTTDNIRIPVNVKASKTLVGQYRRQHRRNGARDHIALVVANPRHSDEHIWTQALRRISDKRDQMLAKRAAAWM